ncbi:MAG: hypothetical protein ABGX03_05625 [Methylophilaceae bacterium]
MKDIIHYLKESGLVRLLPGKKHSKQGLRTRIYPSKDLFNQLYKIALRVEEAFEEPYVTINSGAGIGTKMNYNKFSLDASVAWRLAGEPESGAGGNKPKWWITCSYSL